MVGTGRGTWWAAYGVFGLLGVTWALSITPMGAPDEIAHSRRAVAVARGQVTSESEWVDTPFLRMPQSKVSIPQGYGRGPVLGNAQTDCWLQFLSIPTTCAPRPDATSGPVVVSTTYVGAYQPGYYLFAGIPSRWLPPSTGLYAMRIVSALLAAALLASAAVSLRQMARGPWVIVGFAAALTPTVIFLAASINPNGLEIVASMAVWASLLALIEDRGPPPSRLLARLGLAAVVLACSRPTSPGLLLVIVVSSAAFALGRERGRELWASPRVRALTAVVGLVVLANIVFVVANDSLTEVIRFDALEDSRLDLARSAVGYTPLWLDQALGSLAWIGFGAVKLPVVARWLWWATIALVALLGLVRGTNRQRVVVVLVAGGCIVFPILVMTFSPEVFWQGRYGLPVLVGVPILGGVAADRSALNGSRDRWLASVAVAIVAACQVVAHQQLMTRNLMGLPTRLLRGLLHAPWPGPLSPLILFAMATAGSLGFLALVLAGIWRPEGSVLGPRTRAPGVQPTDGPR